MERALFLIEPGGQRISALLNPEQLEFTRRSGVRPSRAATGAITGLDATDDPVIPTGGGTTELTLDLLFDLDLAGDSRATLSDGSATATEGAAGAAATVPSLPAPVTTDVRELTWPFWNLAENAPADGRRGTLPIVRFIWGRSWNIPGVITGIAERFERFDDEGRPRRSFLRMRLRRVDEPAPDTADRPRGAAASATPFYEPAAGEGADNPDGAIRLEIPVDENGQPSLRFEQLASQYLGDPAKWRQITGPSGIDDPLHIDPGTVISVPRPGVETA